MKHVRESLDLDLITYLPEKYNLKVYVSLLSRGVWTNDENNDSIKLL